ncbi:MAG: hypothetical protein NC399_02825 [Muribaculum sp.]|nr:hypothetical protein [Muribaculum sp.]
MKSILHEKRDGTCYLCMLLNKDHARRTTQEHHVIFGTAGRRLSERYGLKVYLCLQHHEIGPMAVHNNHELARLLQRKAQEAFEQIHTHEEWMRIFGRSYF